MEAFSLTIHEELFTSVYCTCYKYKSMKNKIFLYVLLLAVVILFFSFKNKKAAETMTDFEPVAVVELFTSQGCSSCPSADRLLTKTIFNAAKENKKIFALSFHVDYWNRLGWADPFSNKNFSNRQTDYVSILNSSGPYTPQMVVNGSNEFVGSDEAALSKNLNKALHTNAGVNFRQLSPTLKSNKALTIKYALGGNIEACTINIAVITLKETTAIKRGENEGSTLTNENVVRQLITKNANKEGEIEITSLPNTIKNNIAIIAFVQQKDDYKIIGAASQKIKDEEY
jgi:hypothetical protein